MHTFARNSIYNKKQKGVFQTLDFGAGSPKSLWSSCFGEYSKPDWTCSEQHVLADPVSSR